MGSEDGYTHAHRQTYKRKNLDISDIYVFKYIPTGTYEHTHSYTHEFTHVIT